MKRSSMNSHPASGIAIEPLELEPVVPSGVAPDAAVGLMPLLATGLAPLAPTEGRDQAIRHRLFDRVAHSASVNRAFVTTREQDGVWLDLAEGIQQRALHEDAGAVSQLVRWTHEGELNLPAGAHVHECLVLQGSLQVMTPSAASKLGEQDYLLSPGQAQVWRASAGTCVYWRRITAVVDNFGCALAEPLFVQTASCEWEPLRQGVRIKPLFTQDDRVSMLVAFDAGATVPAHPHSHGEECLMVGGDLFLGDVLLRSGDFQFAPRGSDHGELSSDVGCLLYFHGAIDPAAVDPAVRPAT